MRKRDERKKVIGEEKENVRQSKERGDVRAVSYNKEMSGERKEKIKERRYENR